MKDWGGLPLVIFGTRGISCEVANTIIDINDFNNSKVFDLLGFITEDRGAVGTKCSDISIVACDETFSEFIEPFNVIGIVVPIGTPKFKRKIVEKLPLDKKNIVFPNIIHPTAVINKKYISLGVGNIVEAGVKFTLDIKIGNFNLFNLNTTVGHDVIIEDYCVINPLVSISGRVNIKNDVLIGTGANILERLEIGENSIIGAGAVVTKNIEPDTVAVGIPARSRNS